MNANKKKEVQGAVNISGVDSKTAKRLRQNNGEEREDPKKNNKDFPTKNKAKVDEKSLTPHQRKLHREQLEFDLDESLNFILPDSLEMYEKEMLTVPQKKKSLWTRHLQQQKTHIRTRNEYCRSQRLSFGTWRCCLY